MPTVRFVSDQFDTNTLTSRFTRSGQVRWAAFSFVALLLTGCGSDYPLGEEQRSAAEQNTSTLEGSTTGGGSTAQNSAMTAWRAGFSSLHPKVQVQYASVGSGAGRAGLIEGATQFAGSDAYLQDEEIADAQQTCGADGAINIPAYISPISIAFNLPGIDDLNFDAETIGKIFRSEITQWNEPDLAALNPDVDLPDRRMTVVSRSDDSGTTENFTEYLHEAAPDVWTDDPDGTWPGSLRNENAQGNTGVVSTVVRTEGAITYADDSLVDDTLGKGTLKVGEDFVPVSAEAAAAAVAVSSRVEGRGEHDIALELDRTTTAPGAYPLVLVSYLIYCSEYIDPAAVELVKTFGLYVVSPEGQQLASDSAKSAPMPEALAAEAKAAVESIAVR
ncbi:phosphate ABC transporter substrate-binding protein PstS [Arthrobacter sp. Br18]|uniref:phosphate ABC transporter substrate-binding protein PstS n=1 Tax=Arthrobacter sp. Br18 TaxID=1312954 RepID=UPI0004AE3A7C|nr:phosphate ABC transporter substrate-binding protein PstS [Arthrobacter sp. Br18]